MGSNKTNRAATHGKHPKISSPVTWHGAKARISPQILRHFPPHKTFVEVFGGSAAVLLRKDVVPVEVYNDLDESLVNLFQVMRDPVLSSQLNTALALTPYARSEFERSKQTAVDVVERARRLVVRQRQSYGGRGERWSYAIGDSHAGMSSTVRRWKSGIDSLSKVHQRFRFVQIECDTWQSILERYDSPNTLFFLDPPYVPATRIAGTFKHELSMSDHNELIERLLRLTGMTVLCGYNHASYSRLSDRGWRRVEIDVPAYSSDRRTRRQECLWLSPTTDEGKTGQYADNPIEKMRRGALATHDRRTAKTTTRIIRVIRNLRERNERVTKSEVARRSGVSREHLARRYHNLFL